MNFWYVNRHVIRQRLTEMRWTIADLARASGVAHTTISRGMNHPDNRTDPRNDNVAKVYRVLSLPLPTGYREPVPYGIAPKPRTEVSQDPGETRYITIKIELPKNG